MVVAKSNWYNVHQCIPKNISGGDCGFSITVIFKDDKEIDYCGYYDYNYKQWIAYDNKTDIVENVIAWRTMVWVESDDLNTWNN